MGFHGGVDKTQEESGSASPFGPSALRTISPTIPTLAFRFHLSAGFSNVLQFPLNGTAQMELEGTVDDICQTQVAVLQRMHLDSGTFG